ncbi:serine-rich adhesin for platelets-like isoform X2 [Planococcus citri]|uniref:serine-rich adhesin for platelets-like isoform X2 n=1 Tax=Planococcus citri TaxID=170843 RepID=UPI0031F88F64
MAGNIDGSNDLNTIHDEDTLRHMWQETEDFGRKKEIRLRMYKLREERLKSYYIKRETNTSTSSSSSSHTNSKSMITSSHTDSLNDRGFMSAKTNEIRDSTSPALELLGQKTYQLETKVTSKSKTTADDIVSKAYSTKENNIQQQQYSTSQCNVLDKQVETSSHLLGQFQSSSITDNVTNILDTASIPHSNDISNQIVKSTVTTGQQLTTEMEKSSCKEHNLQQQRQIINENAKILYKSQCGINNSDEQNSASEHTSTEKMNILVVPTRQIEKTNSSHHHISQQLSDDTIKRSTTTVVNHHINIDNSYLDSSAATNEHHNVNLSVDLDCVTQPAATNVQISKISQDVSATHNAFASSLRASASPSPTPSSGFCVSRQASPSPKSSTGHSSPEKTPRVSPEKQVYDHISSKLTASFRNRIASTSTHHSSSSSHTPGGAEKVLSIQLQPCFTSEYDSDDSSATYKKIDTEIKVVDKRSSNGMLKTSHRQQLQKDSYGKLQQNRDLIVANTSKPSEQEINRDNSSCNLSRNSKMQTQTQSRRQSYPPHRSDGVTPQATHTVEQRSFSQNVPQHALKLNPVCTSSSSIQRNTRITSRKNSQVERDSKENKTSDMQQKQKQRESSHSPTKSSIVHKDHKDMQKGTPLISCVAANLDKIPNDSVPKTFTPTATLKPRPSPQKGEIKKCATLPAKSKTPPNSKLTSSQENESDTSTSSSSSTSSLSDEMENYDSIGGSGVTIEEIIDADDNKETQVQQQKIGLLQSTVHQMVKPLSTTTGTLLPQESSPMSHKLDDKQIKSLEEIDDEQKQSSHLTHFELIKDESMEQPSTEMIVKQRKIIKEGEIDGSIPPVEVVLGKQAAKLFTHNQQPKEKQLLPVQQQKKQQLQQANRISTLKDENTALLKQNKRGHLQKMTPVKIVTTTKSTSNNNFGTTPTSTSRPRSNRQQLTSVEINARNGPSKALAGRVKATESSTIKSPNKLVCGTPHMSMQLPSLKKTTTLSLQMTPHKLNSIPTSSNKKQKKERLSPNLNNTVKDVKQKLWKEGKQKPSPSSRKPLGKTPLSNLNNIARNEKKLGKKDVQKISPSSRKSSDYTLPKRTKEHTQIVDEPAKYPLKRPSTTKVANRGEKVQSACKTQPFPNKAKMKKPKSTSILLGNVGHKTDGNCGDLYSKPKNECKYPRHTTRKVKTSTIKQSQTPQSKLKLHNESNTTKASYRNHTSTKPQSKFNKTVAPSSPVMPTLPRCDVKTNREQPLPLSAQPRAKKLFTLTQTSPSVDKKTHPRKDTPNITPSKYKVVATTTPTTRIHNQSRSNKGTTKVVQSKSSKLGINTHPMRLSNKSTLSSNTSNDVLLHLEDVDQDLETQTENVDTAEIHTLEHQQQQQNQNLNVIVRMPSSSRETTPNLPNTECESYPKVVDDEDGDTACPRYADRVIESDDLVTLKRITVPRFEKITHLEEDDQQDETCDKVQQLQSPTKKCEKMLTPTQQTTHINVAKRVSQFQDGHRTFDTTTEPQMTYTHQTHSDGKNVRETKKIWEQEAEADRKKRICKLTDTNENTTLITPSYDSDTNTDNRVTHHKIVSKKLADDDYRLFEAEHASNISQVKQQSTDEAEPRENKTKTSNSTYNQTQNQFHVTNASKIEGVETYQEGGKPLPKTKPIVAENSLTESTSVTNYNSKFVTDATIKGKNVCNGTSGKTSASTKSNRIQPDSVGLSPKPIKMTTVEIKPSKQFDHTAIIRFDQRIAPDEQQPKAESRNYNRKTTPNDDSRSRSRSTSNSSRATKSSPSPTKVDSRNEYQSQHSLITRGNRKLFSGHPIKTKVAKAATPESPHKASAVKSSQRLLQHQTQTGSQTQQRSTDTSEEKRSSTVTTTTTTTTTLPITTSWQQMKEIEEIDDLELLQAMLEEETRYDRRSKIRAQIRAIRREMELRMKKSPSKSPSPEKWLSAQSSTPLSNVRVDKTQYETATMVDTDRRERAKKRLFAAPTTTTPADSNYSAQMSSHGTVSLRNLTTTATTYEKNADNTNAINSGTRAPTKTHSTTKSANADSIRSSNSASTSTSASVYCSRTAMVRSYDKDGKVSVLQEQIDGQIVAKNGREPVGRITHTRIGYETAAKSRRSVSPTTPTPTSTPTQRRISGQRNSNSTSTAKGLSSTSSLIRKLSNERFEKAQRKFNGNCDMGGAGDDTPNSSRRDSTRTTNNAIATTIYTEHGHRSPPPPPPPPTKHHYDHYDDHYDADATADVQTRNYLAQRTQNAAYRSGLAVKDGVADSIAALDHHQQTTLDESGRYCGNDTAANRQSRVVQTQTQTQTPPSLISSTPAAVSLKSYIDYAGQRSRDVRSQSASTVAHATATAVKTSSSVSLSRNAMATTDPDSATQTTEPDSAERVIDTSSSSSPTTFETRRQQTESRLAASASIASKQDYTTTTTTTSSSSSHTVESKCATETSTRTRTSATSTTNSSRIHKANSVTSPFAKFRQLDRQNSLPSSANAAAAATTTTTTTRTSILNFADSNLTRSASSIKDRLLNWVKAQTRDYQNVQIDNFSTSWNNGLAFCALIHHFCPYAFDYDKLTPQQRRYNFELAFRIAEQEAGIVPLLDVDDMVIMKRPDWKCVFTYVQTIYQRFYASPEANAL